MVDAIEKEALEMSGKEFLIKSMANDLGVTDHTTRNSLNQWIEKDLSIQAPFRMGKVFSYLAFTNFESRFKLI